MRDGGPRTSHRRSGLWSDVSGNGRLVRATSSAAKPSGVFVGRRASRVPTAAHRRALGNGPGDGFDAALASYGRRLPLHGRFCGSVMIGEFFMAPLRLHNPPPNASWWRRYWDNFKSNFPNRSGEQARSLVLVLLTFVSLFLLARILFAFFGLPS